MKNRIIALSILILSVLSVWIVPTMAAEPNVVISMETISGTAGETVKVPLEIESNVALSTIGITGFSYDTDALTFNGFTDYGMAADVSITGSLGFDDKNATIALGYNPAMWMYGINICNLSFTIQDTAEAGEYDITFRASIKSGSATVENVECLKGTVNVIRNEPTPHVHDFNSAWSNDSENHWHTCINQPCDAVKDVAAHADNDGDDACDICGYVLAASHVHNADDVWNSDKNTHWQSCTNQPCAVRLNEDEHTPGAWRVEEEATETEDGKRCKYCTVCEKLLETQIIPATEDDDDNNDGTFPWWLLIGGSSGKSYDDVTKSDWFYDDVDYVSDHGLMNGMSVDLFSPYDNTSRAMVVTILYRMAGEPYVYSGSTFADVADGQWYTNAVIWATENNIVSGYGNGYFGPNDSVTREQLAAILYRYAQYCGKNIEVNADVTGYADYANISYWAREAMEWANAEGLINGRTETTIAPSATANRAELAAILHRFCKKVK